MTGTLPQLSIVIVNWNTKDLLLRLLGQLQAIDPERLTAEVLVVDNASSDGSAAAVRAAFPGVLVLPQAYNGGFAHGVNRGLDRARGEFVLLLNTDAEAPPQALEQLLDAAVDEGHAAVYGPMVVDEHGVRQVSTWPRLRPLRAVAQALWPRLTAPVAPRGGAVDCVSGCVFLIRRNALARLGGLDERFFLYYEETDFCERARAHGLGVCHLPEVVFVHRGGVSARQAAARTFLAFRESCLLYHAAWHGRWAAEAVRAALWLGSALRVPMLWLRATRTARHRGRLHAAALRWLSRPALVRELASRPRRVPRFGVAAQHAAPEPTRSA